MELQVVLNKPHGFWWSLGCQYDKYLWYLMTALCFSSTSSSQTCSHNFSDFWVGIYSINLWINWLCKVVRKIEMGELSVSLSTGFPLFWPDKIPWFFPDFQRFFPDFLEVLNKKFLAKYLFFKCGLHLPLGQCSQKYSFISYTSQK